MLRAALVPAAAVLLLAVFAVAAVEAYVSQEGFRAARLERTLHAAEQDQELLRARVAELTSSARVREAAEKLGMHPAPDPITIRVQR